MSGLQHQLDKANAEGDRIRRRIIRSVLTEMDIPADSEVGKYVLDEFKPALTGDPEPPFSAETVFDFLSLQTREDRP